MILLRVPFQFSGSSCGVEGPFNLSGRVKGPFFNFPDHFKGSFFQFSGLC